MVRESITIRLREELIDSLDEEADDEGVSRSEYIRDILADRHAADELIEEVEDLRDRLDAKERRIDELEEQLARRSQIEQKVEDLALEVRERRQEDAPFFVRWYRWWQRSAE